MTLTLMYKMTLIPNPKYIYPNTTAINYFDKYYIFFIKWPNTWRPH